MSIGRCTPLLLLLSTVGCVSFQDFEYRTAQECRAHCAWWLCPNERCSSNPCSHYSCGWRRGYADILLGGDGTCPPVPPQCYWSHKYQCEAGEIAIQEWFQGYRDGGAAGLESCGDLYHPVPMSDEVRVYRAGALPVDRAAYPYGVTHLGPSRHNEPARPNTPYELPDVPASPGDDRSDPGETEINEKVHAPVPQSGTTLNDVAVPLETEAPFEEPVFRGHSRFLKKWPKRGAETVDATNVIPPGASRKSRSK